MNHDNKNIVELGRSHKENSKQHKVLVENTTGYNNLLLKKLNKKLGKQNDVKV